MQNISTRSSPSIYQVVSAKLSSVYDNDYLNFGPYNPLFNVGKECHSDYTTPYNFLELKFNNYTIQPTHILSKSYTLNYPISFSITGIDIFHNTILIDKKENSQVLKNGQIYVSKVIDSKKFLSIKFQLDGKRINGEKNMRDWVLELFLFDIFGTLLHIDSNQPTQFELTYDPFISIFYHIFVVIDC